MTAKHGLSSAQAFLKRHRVRLFDFSAVVIAAAVVLYSGLAIDISIPAPEEALRLEVDELLAASALFLLGMVWALRRLMRERRENARHVAIEREIRQLAYHDTLTGLPNRRQFDEALRAAAAAPPRAGASHGVFMLDLNGFKRINDVFGHATGDALLKAVGERLAEAVRDGDMVARLGGDEFAVLAPNISGTDAASRLALRIVEKLRPAITAGDSKHLVAAAIGVALMPRNGDTPAELLRKADIALYRAKVQGHSAHRFFEEEMDTGIRARDRLERALRLALDGEAILPVYQPVFSLETGRLCGFEARARWHHPEMGDMPPERFIPIAEESGLIGPLTDFLLTRACMDARTWPAHIGLSVDVSPVLLRDPGFGQRLLDLLAQADFPPARLELEITESALTHDNEAARAALATVRDAGVQLVLEDFGIGHASLRHLRDFRFSRLKIDRRFVGTMATDRDSAVIVKALVGLGTALGFGVTAQGVETGEQRHRLAAEGCDRAQGSFYGEAMSTADARVFLAQSDETAQI